jgi:hypothetical protein
MPGYGDNRFLMILAGTEAFIQVQSMTAGESSLLQQNQIRGFDRRPLQHSVHVSADLAHAGLSATRTHARHQTGVTSQVFDGRKSRDITNSRAMVNSSIDLKTKESFRKGRCRVWLRADTSPAEERLRCPA